MQQTLLVLLGLVVLGLYSFSYHRQSTSDERDSIRREVEVAALGVAEDWAARIRRLDFDEEMVGNDTIRVETDVTGLTPKASFGFDAAECIADDVDDLDGFTQTTRYPVRFGEADFLVSVDVRYVERVTSPDTMLVEAAAPTNTKAVRIRSEYLEPASARYFAPDTVSVYTDLILTNAALTLRRIGQGATTLDLCSPAP